MLWLMLYELHVQMAIWKVPGLCWCLEGGNLCCQSIQVSIAIRQCRMGHTTWRTISLVDQPKCEIQLGFQTWSLRFSVDPSAANILWRSPRQLPSICRSMRRIFLPKQTKVHLFCFHKRSCCLLIAAAHLNISPWSSPPRPTAASWPNMPVLDDSRPERRCRNSSIPSCTSSRETNTANTNSINLKRLEQSIQHQINVKFTHWQLIQHDAKESVKFIQTHVSLEMLASRVSPCLWPEGIKNPFLFFHHFLHPALKIIYPLRNVEILDLWSRMDINWL